MQIYSGLDSFYSVEDTAIAIGKFDGVHRGHRRIIEELFRKTADDMRTCIFTFDPSPETFLGIGDGRELTTAEEKRRIFQEIGIDLLVEFPFTEETASMPAETFVTEILVKKLHAQFICAGHDLSFGRDGKGNFALLQSLGKHYGFESKLIHKLQYEGQDISSTLIRSFITDGRMEEAAACLGEPYSIRDWVVHGKRLGSAIGVPTINQLPPEDKILPPYGVYFSQVLIDGKIYKAITNIGVKPTVQADGQPSVETFLYDFKGSLYGKHVEVSLLSYRRPERKMADLAELQKTIREDIDAGKAYHGIK